MKPESPADPAPGELPSKARRGVGTTVGGKRESPADPAFDEGVVTRCGATKPDKLRRPLAPVGGVIGDIGAAVDAGGMRAPVGPSVNAGCVTAAFAGCINAALAALTGEIPSRGVIAIPLRRWTEGVS